MQPLFIFSNPISGRGRGRLFAERLHARLTADGYDVRLFFKRPSHIVERDLPPNAKAAIIIGGDGTLRAVAERLFHLTEPINANSVIPPSEGPPLLMVPMGTANLMGQHLGIGWEESRLEEQVSNAIRTGTIRRLDTAAANGMLFLLIAGVGIDASIVHEVARKRTGPITKLSYALPAVSAVRNYTYPKLQVTVDDRIVFASQPAMAFVGNIPEYGTGFPMLPEASATDGALDVCVLPCANYEQMLHHLLRAAAGEHMHAEGVIYTKGRKVRIDSPEPVPVQIDGDAAGHTPLVIELLPVRLPFIIPAEES